MRRLLVIGATALLPAIAGGALAQSLSPDQREALDAAERWLAALDAGRYADAYAMASDEFKQGVTRGKWNEGIRGIRKDYGRLASRSAEKMVYVGEAPTEETGLAPGAKVAIMFASRFGGKKTAEEEMTMVYEKDGVWRMASYYIR